MIDDHHGPSAGRANLLVRAVDGILGTHRPMVRREARCQAGLMLAGRWVEVLVNPDAHPRAGALTGGWRQARGHEY
jgi:hypothetical protein